MKKLIAILLAATLVMSFTACGTATDSSGTKENSGTNDNSGTKVSSGKVLSKEKITLEPFIAIDNAECSVTVKEIDPDDLWGYTVKVVLENKSSEKTYMFSAVSASVNGVESDPLFATEVEPGKKANGSISFLDSDLKENGITDFTDIELNFKVYDSDDWFADAVANETFHVYPYGQEKATKFVRTAKESDVALVEKEDISVILIGQKDDSIWGYTLQLFIENKSDKELMVSVDNASVNGYMADPFFATSVLPGKCAFTSISWSDLTLEKNDIKKVEEIELNLRIHDANDYFADDIFNEAVKIVP